MKLAGWFLVQDTNNRIVSVCLYCNNIYERWNPQDNPIEIHRQLEPTCVALLDRNEHCFETTSVSRHHFQCELTKPSNDQMADVFRRKRSFHTCPSDCSHSSFTNLAEQGFYFVTEGTRIRCFSCQSERSIREENNNTNEIHATTCAYYGQLTSK